MTMEVGKRIAIVGAGFSGTSVAAMLGRVTSQPLEIILFDKSGTFGAGDAYRTPYSWHILNVRARDMSAFEDQPAHFVDWVSARQQQYKEIDPAQPIGEQFLPRYIYHHYLRDLIQQLQAGANKNVTVKLMTSEVVDAEQTTDGVKLTTNDNQSLLADKVVFAIGNYLPTQFPFPVSHVQTISNPWDYEALEHISPDADVMIVGLGLSMIDAVLTLHQQNHRGKIYAISRHGMLPQPHADSHVPYNMESGHIKADLRTLTKLFRQKSLHHAQQGGDWRAIINALRSHVPMIWENASVTDKKRFIRHVLPYWNVHRHRVHNRLTAILNEFVMRGQLHIMAGRVVRVEEGVATIRQRGQSQEQKINIDWLVNCMGPGMDARQTESPLIHQLTQRGSAAFDPLAIGFVASNNCELRDSTGKASEQFFTLGPPAKGMVWECTAVPEIRKQSFALARVLLTGG